MFPGHYKIKDHPEIFLEPITKKARVHAHAPTMHINDSENHTLPTELLNQSMLQDHSESHVLQDEHSEHDVHPTMRHIDHISTVAHMHHADDHAPTAVDHDHMPMYSTTDMSQHITDDQVAAAVDAAIKTVPVNQTTDYAAAEEAAEVALTAGTNQFGSDDGNGSTEV